ncbi:response regulator [Novipirellula artificiosorum]|uniref:Response regulatory domain-containing protein n=1 Tax=Novipirellula artificiosorum TaxID=2528016 RepID=A0A5C6E084_9BACT|nr:hypothetical protein [Novipirellula artificiosorum]TWU40736.1 hypothetical protein Poly41_15710 [Novipirellula artificiosorum]
MFSRHLLFFATLVGVMLASVGFGSRADLMAQEDLFGPMPAGDLFDDASTNPPTAETEGAEEEPDPFTHQLMVRARRGNLELAESIASLIRIGSWSEANTLLGEVVNREIDEELLAEMSRRIEPALQLRAARHEGTDERAREGIEKLRTAAKQDAASRSLLTQAANDLDHPAVDQRIEAMRRLLRGGNAAIQVLVKSLVSEQPAAPRDDLLRTMLRLGDGGERALRQLALYGSPSVRLRALTMLVRIDKNASMDELLTSLYGEDSSEGEVQFATATLASALRTIPDRSGCTAYLRKKLKNRIEVANRTRNDLEARTLWSVNHNRDGVDFQFTQQMMVAYRDVVDASARLRRIGSLTTQVANEVLAAELGYRVMIDPDWGDDDQIKAFRESFSAVIENGSLVGALTTAIENSDNPAAVGLARLIGAVSDPLQQSEWLTLASPEISPLVRAAISASPRVRFETASAIATFDFHNDYPGSTFVRQTFAEMASLSDSPTAIVVETRPDVLLIQGRILHDLGYEVREAKGVADAERAVNAGGDLRMLVSKTDLADAAGIELVDRVRRSSRGEQLPIVFYGDIPATTDSLRWAAPVLFMDHAPGSPAAYHDLLHELESRRRLPELSPLDRELYRQIGAEAIQSRQ